MIQRVLTTLAAAAALAAASAPAADAAITTGRSVCVNGARVAAVRSNPEALRTVAAKCDAEVRALVPFARTAFERHAVVAALVAHRMAPYGASTTTSLSGLLRARSMNCGNYTYLVFHLMREAFGEAEAGQLRMAGWDFGPFGNHAQLHAGRVMADPTIATFADVTWVELTQGKPAPHVAYLATRDRDSEWNMSVLRALDGGSYREINDVSPGATTTVLYRRGFRA